VHALSSSELNRISANSVTVDIISSATNNYCTLAVFTFAIFDFLPRLLPVKLIQEKYIEKSSPEAMF